MDQSTTIKKYHMTLTADERSMLKDLLSAGKAPARILTHARILLKTDESSAGMEWSDEAIRKASDVSLSTVARVCKRFIEEGLEAALEPIPFR